MTAALRLTLHVPCACLHELFILTHSQQHQIIRNLGAILEEAGSSLNDVVEVNIFLSDLKFYGKVNEVYQNYWGDIKPSRT